MKKGQLGFIILTFVNIICYGQGTITGNFRLNTDFYDRDPKIGAIGANYDANKSSANAWLQTIYTNKDWGLEAGLRFDGNYNSIIQDPSNPTTFNGIGNWYIKKKIDNLEVQAGYIYEQYGSGLALRCFEERSLGIDNAIIGVKAKYRISDNLVAKAIAGVQKNRLSQFGSFIKGVNLEGTKDVNEDMGINYGLSIVNRTLSADDRQAIDKVILTYPAEDGYFAAPYNTVVFHGYNTLRHGNFSWYVEGAYKTAEAIYNPLLAKNQFIYKPGTSVLTSLTYAIPKFGVTLQARRTENFQFQSTSEGSNDFNLNNNRRLAFLAPINRQNSLRMPARFQVAPQDIGEIGLSFDATYKFSKNISLNLSLCAIDSTGKTDPYYREGYFDTEIKKFLHPSLSAHFGFQYVYYNQFLYQRDGAKDVVAYTPFMEFSYKLDRKKSVRLELQYQNAEKELGQSAFALLEFNVAPHWSMSITDLYNFKPNKDYYVTQYRVPNHFYSAFVAYTKDVTRLTLAYVKQLQGIVCTGGVCRVEPAFSGIRAQLTTSF